MILMLISFMQKPNIAIKSSLWGIGIASLMVVIVVLWVLMTLGPSLASVIRFSAFDMVSYISIMNFIQNLEIVAILIWILSVFIKVSLYFFLACYGTAKLFNIQNWKKLIWLLGILLFFLAVFYPGTSYSFGYMKTYWVYIALPINMVGIPLLLWVIGSIRKKFA
ncbi:GerAB/ArcD/ProY family transporter [Bacillus sp. FJAT-49736]|nr:GerAB/ArcD/ProY family transporter [Bacillus sp. FJAT-49736]